MDITTSLGLLSFRDRSLLSRIAFLLQRSQRPVRSSLDAFILVKHVIVFGSRRIPLIALAHIEYLDAALSLALQLTISSSPSRARLFLKNWLAVPDTSVWRRSLQTESRSFISGLAVLRKVSLSISNAFASLLLILLVSAFTVFTITVCPRRLFFQVKIHRYKQKSLTVWSKSHKSCSRGSQCPRYSLYKKKSQAELAESRSL